MPETLLWPVRSYLLKAKFQKLTSYDLFQLVLWNPKSFEIWCSQMTSPEFCLPGSFQGHPNAPKLDWSPYLSVMYSWLIRSLVMNNGFRVQGITKCFRGIFRFQTRNLTWLDFDKATILIIRIFQKSELLTEDLLTCEGLINCCWFLLASCAMFIVSQPSSSLESYTCMRSCLLCI